MRERSAIEWTDSTWNPVTGCTRVSAGCDNCYALTLAHVRLRDTYLKRPPVIDTPDNREDPFAVRMWPERLGQPAQWKDSRMIFVNSMSDLFHKDIPESYIREIFSVMLKVSRHTYQVLTKRPGRAASFWNRNREYFGLEEIPSHVWIGTSVESQEVHYRVRQIRQVPAAVRFLSCEPLLDSLTLDLDGIHWVIVGGESGAGCRPMNPDWVRSIQQQCENVSVPFFFKQWGGRTPKAGGRLLDGNEWSQYPVIPEPASL